MSELPPPVLEAEFRTVDTTNEGEIQEHFREFIAQLHSFLNRTSCLCNIQDIRRRKNRDIKPGPAFKQFNTAPRHWYTHHHGGRSEAQFNIGLFPNYLRVGLGFEFTKGRQREEGVEAVWDAYNQFTAAIRRDRWTFDQCVLENSLKVEWAAEGERALTEVRTQEVSEWLLKPPQNPRWIFIGRLLGREKDAEILEDSVQLREVMEATFGCLRPFWEQTQMPLG